MNLTSNKFSLNFKKGIYSLFFFFVFFPFVSPIKTSTDMQPYSVVCAILLLPSFKFSISRSQILISFFPLIAFLLLFVSDFSFNSLRSLYNYISLFIIYYVYYMVLSLEFVITELPGSHLNYAIMLIMYMVQCSARNFNKEIWYTELTMDFFFLN